MINILNEAIDEAHKVQRARIARGETEDKPDENSDKKDIDKKVSDEKASGKKVCDEKAETEEPKKDLLEEETASA